MHRTITSALVIAILLANAVALAGFPIASAQIGGGVFTLAAEDAITIDTSGDNHEGRFFGEGVLRVVITDPDTDDGDDVIMVRLNAESEGDGGSDSGTFLVPNTNPGSQRFEFYLVHAASQYADGRANDDDMTELDTANPEGFDDPADGFDGIAAPIIRFGADSGSGVELQTGSSLYEEVNIEIQYDDRETTVSYEQTTGILGSDRDVYGSDGILYLAINDQDANLNPTVPDSFSVTDSGLGSLFELSGASFVDNIVFEETGDNTAIFEGRFRLSVAGDSPGDVPPELLIASFASSSISVSLNDMANYANLTAGENDSNDASEINIVIDNRDGTLDGVGALTFGSELRLTLRDHDQNKDSQDDETLSDVVLVRVGNGDSDGDGTFELGEADQELLDMEETEDNSGIFVIDSSNNELKVTFLPSGSSPIPNNGILELRKADIDSDVSISYRDTLDDDSSSSITSAFRIKMQTVAGAVGLQDSAGLNDDFVMTLAESDLNDNPRTRDSYTFSLAGGSGAYFLKRGGSSLAELAMLELEIAGRTPVFTNALNYTFVETDVDSGVFDATLDMRDILASAAIDADDGDTFRITYNDLMARTSRESSDTLVIRRASTAVDFSRSVLPVPPEDNPSDHAPESSIGGLVGTRVTTTLLVTDVRENTQPNSQNAIAFKFRNDPGIPRPAFSIKVEGRGILETVDTMAKYDGSDQAGEFGNTGAFLRNIMPELPHLSETGRSTGLFEEEMVFVNDGTLDSDEWNNLKVIFTYYNDINDDESAGITFRGHDAVLSTDMASVRSGDNITITVQDGDLNLDDTEVEEFRTSLDTRGIFLVAIEPEDNEIETKSVSTRTLRETGPNTGTFTATLVVGSDIPVAEDENGGDEEGVEINQATVIEITYNDEVDSTGNSGDEIELAIPVATSTGTIQVMPEDSVGPGTRLTVLVVDNDLNFNPRGTERFEGDDHGDGIVVFRTDRRDAGRASPDLKEIDPNSGVLRFELELVPIKGGDDGEPIDAEGGSKPQIGVLPGDLLAIRYEDESDGRGNTAAVSKVIEIKSWDPLFSQHKDAYEENDRVTIDISDPDANRNPDVADSIRELMVYSQSDRVGRTYSAPETDRDSGIFRLSFSLTTGKQSGAIPAYNGDEVTIQYEDEFPEDYAERIKQTDNADKKFFHTIIIGTSMTGTASTSTTAPALKDATGKGLAEAIIGQQVVVSTTIQNNNAKPQPYVTIVEVRDSNGISETIEWQTGILNSMGSSDIGISWRPQKADSYHLRTVVISDFEAPRVLSPVAASEVTVTRQDR